MITGLGLGLNGRGAQLNAVLGDAAPIAYHAGRLSSLLDGDRLQVSDLVGRLDDLAGAIGARDHAIDQIASDGLTTFSAVAARDQALRRFIDVLPSTLTQVKKTSTTLASVTQTAAPVVAGLATAASDLRPAIQSLAPASKIGRIALDELQTATPRLRQTLADVKAFSQPAAKMLPALEHDVLCQVNPMLKYVIPYVPDINGMVTNMEDATQNWDAGGHVAQVTLDASEGSLGGLPASTESAMNTLLHSGLLSVFPNYSYDPYPPPGLQKTQTALNTPNYTGPVDFGEHSGYKYPHITASC
jgi:ABC-type transporter Mla subunit MlaD